AARAGSASAPDENSAAPRGDGYSAAVAPRDDSAALPVDDSILPEQLDVDLELADAEPADWAADMQADRPVADSVLPEPGDSEPFDSAPAGCPGGSPVDLQATAGVVLGGQHSAEPPDGQWWP